MLREEILNSMSRTSRSTHAVRIITICDALQPADGQDVRNGKVIHS